MSEPVPFEVYRPGVFLHGTKADLVPGDMLLPGRESNYQQGRLMRYVYFTATLDAAVWGAELAVGDGPGRVYIVEPTGVFEDDPNVTDKRFPGNPTRSFSSREPVRIVEELLGWVGHSPERLRSMRDGLAATKSQGSAGIEDRFAWACWSGHRSRATRSHSTTSSYPGSRYLQHRPASRVASSAIRHWRLPQLGYWSFDASANGSPSSRAGMSKNDPGPWPPSQPTHG